MAALAAKNETTRAVGNVPMNARGDRLNEDGTVKMKAEDIAVAHQNLQQPPDQTPISDPKQFVSEFDSNKITINGMDIDMSEVEGAYDSDYDNEMNPDKQELGVDQ